MPPPAIVYNGLLSQVRRRSCVGATGAWPTATIMGMGMSTVRRWTGREARILREAYRLSVRNFAKFLGVGARTVSAWDADPQICPRPELQAVLDTALARADDGTRARFELGLAPTRSPRNLDWTADPDRLLLSTNHLWDSELADSALVPEEGMANNVAALRWLMASEGPTPTHHGPLRVGLADLQRIRQARKALKAVDHMHGGGSAFPAARTLLRRELAPLLAGAFTGETGKALFGLVAEVTLDVGWMAYDAGDHRLGRAYFSQSLGFAQAAENRVLGGRALSAMSHQMLHLGEAAIAADLARAARIGSAQAGQPRAVAMFAAMEAMAEGAMQREASAAGALTLAEKALEAAGGDDGPDQLDFNEGGLWGHAARVYRDLGKGPECVQYAELAIAGCHDDHIRTRAQRRAILATALTQIGDIDQAADVGSTIISETWKLQSRHVYLDVETLVAALNQARSVATSAFRDCAREYLATDASRRSHRRAAGQRE